MICPGCDKPEGGLYMLACRACTLRNIARGPAFWQSQRDGKLTPAYRRQLEALGVPGAVHQEVKAARNRMSERVAG